MKDAEAVRVGIALPSFVSDPAVPMAVAAGAEAAGLDAAFCYDHLFRETAAGERRPALEATTLLGAIAASTHEILVGTLVARATLRPPAQLAAALDTVQRISGGRLVAALGAGDSESRAEMVTFGYDFGTPETRIDALEAAVCACRGRGYPVWVGGRDPGVREVAGRWADGWNAWGADPETFRDELAHIVGIAQRPFTATWGGLVLIAADEQSITAKRERFTPGPHVVSGTTDEVAAALRPWIHAGAEWIIAAPLDSSDPANAELLAEVRSKL